MARQRLDVEPVAQRRLDVDQEDRKPFALLLHLIERRGARQQEHEIGLQRPRGPDLLAVDDVVVVPRRSARVLSLVVSEPVVGSVTPKACSRSRPAAISGRYFCFCSGLP